MPNKSLTVGMMGDNVAGLQQALSAIGLSIPEAETKRRFFGPATRQAVCECQKRHGLVATGEVDDATASLLETPRAAPVAAGTIAPEAAGPVAGMAVPPASEFLLASARSRGSLGDVLATLPQGEQLAKDHEKLVPARAEIQPITAKAATERPSGIAARLLTMDPEERPKGSINVEKTKPAPAQPVASVTTSEPARAAPTEMPVAASSAEMNVEEKKSAMVITEGATAEPFFHDRRSRIDPLLPALSKLEPEPLTIKGNFTIFDRNLKISPRDFQFYELSAEISGPDGAFQVLRCAFEDNLCVRCGDLSVDCPDLSVDCPEGYLRAGTDQKMYFCSTDFQFPQGPLIVKPVKPGTTASVRVIVKSFEGVRVWSKEYKADHHLNEIIIKVPLQRPITRTSATKRTKSTNDKKLRGQVLELSKKCKLKDLTVVIQAKASGDTLWRIVGAGRTDSAGNFSLPYPFGVFDEAQALVSATPNSPATVKRKEDGTIAEDFLYLLLKDIECPQDEGEADCDCNGKRHPSRLPDQADLIGSDAYTQDIGGSCINLSTPNRTLSEFNYQAIVRTYDPDVANYTLKKCEDKPKPAGLDPVRMLEISRALTALDSGLRNPAFQNALPSAALSAALQQFAALRTLLGATPNVDVVAAIKSVDALISNVVSALTQNVGNAVTPGGNTSGTQGGSVSAATIEAEISRVINGLTAAAAGLTGSLSLKMLDTACAGVGNELHVCLRKNDGRFFHAIRNPDGSWNGFNDGSGIPNAGNDNAFVACAGVGNELHVCLRKNDGRFFHAIRNPDGSWNGFNDGSGIPNAGNDNAFVACAGVGNELHVCLRKNDGRFFHAIRNPDGSWIDFNDGSGIPNAGNDNAFVACAGVGNELHVCLRKNDGRFFHAIRNPDGSWNGFNDGSGIPNAGNDNAFVACAGVGNELHVCLRKNDGRFFHAIRNPDGSWNGFNDGSGIPNAGNDNAFVACAGVGNELHVCLRKNDGRFFHAIRNPDGSWIDFNDGSGIPNAGNDNTFLTGESVTRISWDTLEGAIRQAVINTGGMPLTPTFFFQFEGWRVGEVKDALSTLLFKHVVTKAAAGGAGDTAALPGAGASALPMQSSKAVSYIIELANDLRAHLNAAQLIRMETRYELVPGAKKRQRNRVDLDNLVAWQDDDKSMTLYQAVTVATGHILHYKSEFKADGYSLGDVVYSLPLAPGQTKQIVVLDASHRLMGTESQTLSQGERLAASIFDERTIISRLGGQFGESLRGASSANTSGISAGFGTGGQGYGGMGASGGSSGGYGGSGSAVIGIAGGVANANSTARQDSSRNVSQYFEETLRQSIMQNANAYRQLNASVVTTVEEGQRYGVTSEVVANHNHCHALTIMYFEVLRHYAIFQRLSSVEECVFVPLLMTNFTAENIYKWRDVLAKSLLPMPSDTYLQTLSASTPSSPQQHPLVRAFDATERVITSYANVDYPDGSYDEEKIEFIRGNMRIRVQLPRPRTRFDRIMSFPVIKQIDEKALADAVQQFARDTAGYATKAAFTAGLSTAFEKLPEGPNPREYEVLATEAIADAFMSLDANYQSVPPAQCMRIVNFKPQPISLGASLPTLNPAPSASPALDFFAENLDDRKQWQLYSRILGYSDVEAMLNAYFKGNLIAEWDSIFYTDIAPLVFEKIISRITSSEFSTDFSSETKYKGGEIAMRLNLTGAASKKRNQLPLELKLGVNDQNFKQLKNYITFNVEDLTISYSTAHYNGVLYSGNVNDDLFDDTSLYIPENSEEKRNPRKEDAYLVYKLIEHLNSNIEHYNKALWYNLDPDRRFMLLDGFDIQIFNDYGLPIGRRSLASVVKNELVTVTGNSLVFPVAAGYRVSQSYIVEDTGDGAVMDRDLLRRHWSKLTDDDLDLIGNDREELVDVIEQRYCCSHEEAEEQVVRYEDEEVSEVVSLLDHYQPLTPIEPYRISVPTRGVFAEAVPGACNACEKIETDRLQDWNRFPNTDQPTPISPVTVPTPGVTDWRAAFKELATPLINIQNAPAAPAPGAGLAGLSELLGKSGVFKDITGLDANQQNVIRTYLSNQENAKAFGEMAKEMAMQQHNTQNSGRITDQITAAKNSGDITKQEAGQLTKDHLQQQIDGGARKKAELDKATREARPSVAQAGVNAINRGRGDVTATVEQPGGFVESVTVKNSALAEEVTEPLPGDLAAERDWARLHPVPESTVEDMLLSLWNYPVGKTDLAPEHRAALDQFLKEALVGAQLGGSEVPAQTEIYITGHASNTGDKAANETFSRQRAKNVERYLLDRGIMEEQMRVDSAGASDPAEPGHTGFAAARNRRVDVLKFTPSGPERPPTEESPPTPPEIEVPDALHPVVPDAVEEALLAIKGGATVGEIVVVGLELVAAEAMLSILSGVVTLLSTILAAVNANDEGLRHDRVMGWVYTIAWAIDDIDNIRRGLPRKPPPTGEAYNPTGVGSAREQRMPAFDLGVDKGFDTYLDSAASLDEEKKKVAADLTVFMAWAVRKFGQVAGHKYFVTHLYRLAYKESLFDHLDHKKWCLNWPTIGVEDTSGTNFPDCL